MLQSTSRTAIRRSKLTYKIRRGSTRYFKNSHLILPHFFFQITRKILCSLNFLSLVTCPSRTGTYMEYLSVMSCGYWNDSRPEWSGSPLNPAPESMRQCNPSGFAIYTRRMLPYTPPRGSYLCRGSVVPRTGSLKNIWEGLHIHIRGSVM